MPNGLEYIRKTYNVSAIIGSRVRFDNGEQCPIEGEIVGSHGGNLRVQMDGASNVGTYHPTWKIEYLPQQ